MKKNRNMDLSNLIEEFEWTINVLNSVASKKQLSCAENCFELWKKKYSNYTLNIISRLSVVYKNYLERKQKELGVITNLY